MYLFYFAESGNTGLDLSSTVEAVHWLVALGATEHDVRRIDGDVRALADSYFGHRAGTPGFELHGVEIFGGRGVARTLAPARRVDLFAEVLGLLVTHDVQLWVRGIHKARLRERSRARREALEHPSILAFRDVVTSLETWLQARQPAPGTPCSSATNQLGLLVSDQQDEVSRALAAEFAHRRDSGIRSLIDTIHYVRSRDSRLIQLVDCVAFIRNRYEKNLTKCGGDEARFGKSAVASGRARKKGARSRRTLVRWGSQRNPLSTARTQLAVAALPSQWPDNLDIPAAAEGAVTGLPALPPCRSR